MPPEPQVETSSVLLPLVELLLSSYACLTQWHRGPGATQQDSTSVSRADVAQRVSRYHRLKSFRQ